MTLTPETGVASGTTVEHTDQTNTDATHSYERIAPTEDVVSKEDEGRGKVKSSIHPEGYVLETFVRNFEEDCHVHYIVLWYGYDESD